MRIQILNLPHIVLGEVVTEPFALIVDQYDGPTDAETVALWAKFRENCGAKAIGFHPGTVEVVDRYAEPAPQEPVPGNVEALRDLARLADYVYANFRDDAAKGGGTIVDVAMRLLGEVLQQRETQKLTAGWPRIQRDRSEDDT